MWGTLIAGGKAVFDWMREERREWRTTIEAHTEESTEISRDLRQLLEKEDQEMRLLKELTDEVRRRNGKE
jgi:RNase P/RNase MRP subunit p30